MLFGDTSVYPCTERQEGKKMLLPMMSHGIPVIASAISANCSDQFASTVNGGLQTVIQILMALGVVIAVVGIIAGGLMRTTSWLAWGSESQRIMMSNMAITGAVIGLVIVLVGATLGGQIPNWFSQSGCSVS
jgi:hypothetical protein